MAQSNLAREPSMDEILASIRKIIESNETVGPGLPANDQGPLPESFFDSDRTYLDHDSAEDIQLTIDDSVFPDYEETFVQPTRQYVEPTPLPVAAPAAIVPTPSAPLSLADVAARVRAASERQSAPKENQQRGAPSAGVQAREPQVREPQVREPQVRDPQGHEAQASERQALDVQALAPIPVESEPSSAVHPFQTEATVSSAFHPAGKPSVEAAPDGASDTTGKDTTGEDTAGEDTYGYAPVSSGTPVPDVRKPDDAGVVARASSAGQATATPQPLVKDVPAIVSEAVSDQVARSFGELALALDSSARRSFDEIAEEMLRPMLQEWLDDNLPTLVERLVREEIERVARGPRR